LPSTTTAPEDIQAVLEALNTERIQVIGDDEAAMGSWVPLSACSLHKNQVMAGRVSIPAQAAYHGISRVGFAFCQTLHSL
jgi:hypothetical protein